MFRSKTLGIIFILIFSIITIENTNAFIIESDQLKYNVKEGDVIGIFVNNTDVTIDTADPSNNETKITQQYLKYQCIIYSPLTIINGSEFRNIAFFVQSYGYNPLLAPDFTKTTNWINEDPESYYVNRSTESDLMLLGRVMLPIDIDVVNFIPNASLFVHTLMTLMGNGHDPTEQVINTYDDITNQTELSNIIYSNEYHTANLTWSFYTFGYKYPNPIVNMTIEFNMTLTFEYVLNNKGFNEFFRVHIFRNMTQWNNITGYLGSQSNNNIVSNILVYDSDPLTFWDIYGYTWLIGIIVVSGGVIAFFTFYYSKCKVNPTYSAVCKVYRKSPPKSKNSNIIY